MTALAAILWTLVALLAAALLYGALVGARALRLERIVVQLPHLPAAAEGFAIAHVSDLHLKSSKLFEPVWQRAIEMTMQAAPDLIVITGDIAAGAENMDEVRRWLPKLSARHGVFAVLGNHDLNFTMERALVGDDWHPSIEAWRSLLDECGVRLLHNQWHLLELDGWRLLLVGVGDASHGADDIDAAFAGAPSADLVIMLSHSPDIIDRPGAERADLILCGHTHGGQMMIPGLGPAWAPVWRDRRRGAGLLRFGDVAMHVSRGVGTTWPVRLNCPPHVAVLELRRGPLNGRPLQPELSKPQPGSEEVAG